VTTPTILSYELGKRMVERKRGAIGIVSSIAALVGCAFMSTYSATKAYEWILGEGLYGEYRPFGVEVVTYILGSTATPTFIERYGHNIDPSRAGTIEVEDPLQTLFNRQAVPTTPEDAAKHMFDNFANGPVLYSDPIDERAANKMLAMPRNQLVDLMSKLVLGET
jgi:short-subunit dehydrogenase